MTDDERAALREQIAEALWHRYAPSHHIAWADEPHRAEYIDPAEAILAAIEPAIRADERARVVEVLHDGMDALDALVGERLGGDADDDEGKPLRGSYQTFIPWSTRSQARAALAAIRAALDDGP